MKNKSETFNLFIIKKMFEVCLFAFSEKQTLENKKPQSEAVEMKIPSSESEDEKSEKKETQKKEVAKEV